MRAPKWLVAHKVPGWLVGKLVEAAVHMGPEWLVDKLEHLAVPHKNWELQVVVDRRNCHRHLHPQHNCLLLHSSLDPLMSPT